MSKDDFLKLKGRVTEKFPAGRFLIETETGATVQGFLSGKIRINNIMINVGDEVELEISTYDLSKGRIVYRY